MTLETLKGVTKIGGFNVVDLDKAKLDERFLNKHGLFDWDAFDLYRRDYPISVMHSENMVSFKFQQGLVKENGVNGCQVDTLIRAAELIISKLNKNFPCAENEECLSHLSQALNALESRKKDRTKRGVEGLSKK